MKTYKTYSTRQTLQSESIPGKKMNKNFAGGFSFEIDDWERLDRFLILGNEGGTYYASAKKLTKENANCVLRCINLDGIKTVNQIIGISDSGRAPKNDPALFALAMCAGLGDEKTRQHALSNLPKVARIGTHLFHFISYAEQFRGWGRSLSTAVKKWYQEKTIDNLAYQVVKYQSRDGWSHRDLLRLSHPKAKEDSKNSLYKWIVSGEAIDPIHKLIEGYERAKIGVNNTADMRILIQDYGLTREMIPTEWLNHIDVWDALLEKMPLTAMIRNLGKMTSIGLIKPMSNAVNKITTELSNIDRLKKSRIHPLSILVALKIYAQGHGEKGKLSWNPVSQIIDSLDSAFYSSFETIEPTNQRWLLGIDVSGSMDWNNIAGMPLTPRIASGAMALITASIEKKHHIMGFSDNFISLPISPRQRLDDVLQKISRIRMGGTDCSLPMLWAIKNKIEIDNFVIYTDNETWFGNIHPCQALIKYRQEFGIPAKLIVVGMTATQFSIADPLDSGMMDIIGFDTASPSIMNNFAIN